MKDKLYVHLASLAMAIINCEKSDNTEWKDKHTDVAEALVKEHLPSGGGFDSGTKIDLARCDGKRLVFTAAFHHMDDVGYYDGWSEHEVVITPHLAFGFELRVTGRDRNDIKNYIAETFHAALSQEIER